jgi:hypothetical protein
VQFPLDKPIPYPLDWQNHEVPRQREPRQREAAEAVGANGRRRCADRSPRRLMIRVTRGKRVARPLHIPRVTKLEKPCVPLRGC